MIPKIIHYCWFGRGKMPSLAVKCMDSWKRHLPDYQFKLWNEDNFDVNKILYVKEAYESRKFAFVTDYVRLHALYNEGGIYMDTDVEVLKNFDDLLNLPAFSGFESETDVPTGIMASEKGGYWVNEQLQYYKDRPFIVNGGSMDMTTNVQIISNIMLKNGFELNNTFQVYKDCMHIFPTEFFCPKNRTGVITLTENTYCIHHFASSWESPRIRAKKYVFEKIIGSTLRTYLVNLKKITLRKLRRLNK